MHAGPHGSKRLPPGTRKAPPFRHIRAAMSALANHAFVKMNGLGNEIVVVDMRAGPAADQRRRSARAARRRALPTIS